MAHGSRLREVLGSSEIVPFIGVYDAFSATLAGRHFDGLFLSGFGFAASHYGLPDVGFVAWPDMVDFTRRVRAVLPGHHLLVDIDDGYSDPEVACHVVSLLQGVASGVVLEDQRRPRRCGHFDGKQLLPLEEYVAKLERVISTRRDLYVVARTDADEPGEIARRLEAYARAGADAVLADGLRDLDLIRRLGPQVSRPFAFNQIAGGKSPVCGLGELAAMGVRLAIYSTPCLFAAHAAIDDAMQALRDHDGHLRAVPGRRIEVKECKALLDANLAVRS
jgi:2-methylisocitrate lyase-like PEP mutase family enzyme